MGWLCILPLLLILAGSIIRAVYRVREAQQERAGLHTALMLQARLCLKCGYDVRVHSGVCPECGYPVATGAPPSLTPGHTPGPPRDDNDRPA